MNLDRFAEQFARGVEDALNNENMDVVVRLNPIRRGADGGGDGEDAAVADERRADPPPAAAPAAAPAEPPKPAEEEEEDVILTPKGAEMKGMSCMICYESFNTKTRIPKIFPCGHTFCISCVTSLSKNRTSRPTIMCPTCRQNTHYSSSLGADKIPTNYCLLAMLEQRKEEMGNQDCDEVVCVECQIQCPGAETTMCQEPDCVKRFPIVDKNLVDTLKRPLCKLICRKCIDEKHKRHPHIAFEKVKAQYEMNSKIVTSEKDLRRVLKYADDSLRVLDLVRAEVTLHKTRMSNAIGNIRDEAQHPAIYEYLRKFKESLNASKSLFKDLIEYLGNFEGKSKARYYRTFGTDCLRPIPKPSKADGEAAPKQEPNNDPFNNPRLFEAVAAARRQHERLDANGQLGHLRDRLAAILNPEGGGAGGAARVRPFQARPAAMDNAQEIEMMVNVMADGVAGHNERRAERRARRAFAAANAGQPRAPALADANLLMQAQHAAQAAAEAHVAAIQQALQPLMNQGGQGPNIGVNVDVMMAGIPVNPFPDFRAGRMPPPVVFRPPAAAAAPPPAPRVPVGIQVGLPDADPAGGPAAPPADRNADVLPEARPLFDRLDQLLAHARANPPAALFRPLPAALLPVPLPAADPPAAPAPANQDPAPPAPQIAAPVAVRLPAPAAPIAGPIVADAEIPVEMDIDFPIPNPNPARPLNEFRERLNVFAVRGPLMNRRFRRNDRNVGGARNLRDIRLDLQEALAANPVLADIPAIQNAIDDLRNQGRREHDMVDLFNPPAVRFDRDIRDAEDQLEVLRAELDELQARRRDAERRNLDRQRVLDERRRDFARRLPFIDDIIEQPLAQLPPIAGVDMEMIQRAEIVELTGVIRRLVINEANADAHANNELPPVNPPMPALLNPAPGDVDHLNLRPEQVVPFLADLRNLEMEYIQRGRDRRARDRARRLERERAVEAMRALEAEEDEAERPVNPNVAILADPDEEREREERREAPIAEQPEEEAAAEAAEAAEVAEEQAEPDAGREARRVRAASPIPDEPAVKRGRL